MFDNSTSGNDSIDSERRRIIGGIGVAICGGRLLGTTEPEQEQDHRRPIVTERDLTRGVIDLELQDVKAGDVLKLYFENDDGVTIGWASDVTITEQAEQEQRMTLEAENLEASAGRPWVGATIIDVEFTEVRR